jgi:hypothetical protein
MDVLSLLLSRRTIEPVLTTSNGNESASLMTTDFAYNNHLGFSHSQNHAGDCRRLSNELVGIILVNKSPSRATTF